MGPTLSTENHQTNQYESNHRPMNKETLFILDWDDTLMCTSFISLKSQPLSKEEQNQILNLGNIVSIFLSQCLKYGRVIILTNSSENWVKGTSIENLGITDLLDSSISYLITIKTSAENRRKVRREALRTALLVLEKHHVSVPYPQMDVHAKK